MAEGDQLKPGNIVAGKFRIEEQLSKGFLGSVYKAVEIEPGIPRIVRVFDKERAKSFPEYAEHLRSLARLSFPQLSLPLIFGETNDYFYVVEEHYSDVETLDSVIRREAPLHPSKALSILAEVAEGLDHLHSRSIIHADIKPSNILVSESADSSPVMWRANVHLIDFGMVQSTESEEGLLLIGTYHYMHPELKGQFQLLTTTQPSRVKFHGRVGPYIDLFALGMVSLEMLIGKDNTPLPLTRARISAELLECNHWLRRIRESARAELVDLLFKMLSIRSHETVFSAKSIFESAKTLEKTISVEIANIQEIKEVPSRRVDLKETPTQFLPVYQTVERLEKIAESLSASTAAFFSKDTHLETLHVPQVDNELLFEMNTVFSNVLSRTKNSWRIAVGMTITSFLLITSMIITTVIISVTTGETAWALILGGASVSLVLGTLIWRPFDRMFRATILSQQIEMIHLQTSSAFRGTKDPERRIQLCREAIASLETLFSRHAIPEPKGKSTKKK